MVCFRGAYIKSFIRIEDRKLEHITLFYLLNFIGYLLNSESPEFKCLLLACDSLHRQVACESGGLEAGTYRTSWFILTSYWMRDWRGGGRAREE